MSKQPLTDGLHAQRAQPMLLKVADVCHLLGGIHPRTLSRMEKAGIIRSVHLLRHKMYATADITNLVEDLRKWKA